MRLRGADGRPAAPAGGRIGRARPPNCSRRPPPTSSVLLLSKDSEMAPLTLPAARKGPLGQKDSVAERSAVLSMAARADHHPAPIGQSLRLRWGARWTAEALSASVSSTSGACTLG